jgi:hypothetical protein
MEQRAIRALRRTWEAIGGDYLQLAAEDGATHMKQDEVIDAVSACGFKGGYPMTHGDDKEAVEWLESQMTKVQDKLLKEAFPHARYS